ncbi:TetR/AcrR family transcriptional regulator [Clostridium hydrogenum]|uniref:TetR/AcrR family transcriptional regulator n=1 Tax=Clostridium hydrogenum TaxID=2855764 RepID=UPI001F16C606|nr:TetR-like C-terminal domain-containing protein [Clostridium hydrogenum]
MSSSLVTKNALASSLKSLMKEYAINKISVKMVTDKCGVTRHTFYNHFHDVYELLEWIFENEVIDELDEHCSLSNWKEGISIVLQYTLDNKIICTNTCNSLGREHLELFLTKTFNKVLSGVISDITKNMKVDENLKQEVSEFFSYAISGEFLHWINGGLKEKKEDIADRVEIMLDGTILRIMNANKDKPNKT